MICGLLFRANSRFSQENVDLFSDERFNSVKLECMLLCEGKLKSTRLCDELIMVSLKISKIMLIEIPPG